MKFKILIPNSSSEFLKHHTEEMNRLNDTNIILDVEMLKAGPTAMISTYGELISGTQAIKQIKEAEQQGFDAVIIQCAMDPYYYGAQEAVDIPVIGAGMASHFIAMSIAEKFSVVTLSSQAVNGRILKNIIGYGYQSRLASVESAGISIDELENREKAFNAILKSSETAVAKGANAIVLGCCGMSWIENKLSNAISLPVINPATSGLYMAQTLARMNLSKSRTTFIKPDMHFESSI